MISPSRDQARRFLIAAWDKRRAGMPQSPLETLAADIVALHPEYQALLEAGEDALSREWTPEQGQTNPFLHLSLHLAIEEQLSIDQPPGIVAAFNALVVRHGDRHAALHQVLECLGQAMWQAQRESRPPDAAAYLESLRRLI